MFSANPIVRIMVCAVVVCAVAAACKQSEPHNSSVNNTEGLWVAPSLLSDIETTGSDRELVIYGEQLLTQTGRYFGPAGIVAKTANGMNCQNCHLDGGRRLWGNNYSGVYSTYPIFRQRSGQVEDIYKRINDCFQRSLAGDTLSIQSKEMQAIYAYMKWIGKNVPKGTRPVGAGLQKLAYLDRAASIDKGRKVYIQHCRTCHGNNGQGLKVNDQITYTYPPLWGRFSYTDGAGMHRLSNFSSFVKNNMPFDKASHQKPVLTTEQAWDVAAFVNSQPRPHFNSTNDYPNLGKKPIDAPWGPYADTFPQQQHKYGPFKPMVEAKK